MSEFSLSSTTLKKTHFSSLLLSDFFLFCSFILSHPLYFFYFIFFFPYLFKLLSFLSPLFITTFLLLSVFLTFSPNLVYECLSNEFAESKVSFMHGMYQAVVERFRSKVEEDGNVEFDQFEELEAYKIVFDTSDFDVGGHLDQDSAFEGKENSSASDQVEGNKNLVHEDHVLSAAQVLTGNLDDNSRSENSQLIAEGKKLNVFLHQKEECEEKETKALSENSKKVEEQKQEPYIKISGSKEMGYRLRDTKVNDDNGEHLTRMNSERIERNPWSLGNGGDYTPKFIENSPSMRSNLGSFGSMRKEKEWRRTLACKLFEERHKVEGGEGMDLLWETYETDSMKLQAKTKTNKAKKGSINEYDDDDDEEEEENDGQLCCLQALKFSAGKMNLGMGRPNLVKISKALKGIGWLHHVSKKKSHH